MGSHLGRERAQTVPWNSLFFNPGLSHLATEILLKLDVEFLSNVELVCKAWRRHVLENSLWRNKLMRMARTTSFNMELVEEAIKDTTDKEELHKKCKSLCWDIAARHKWLDPNAKVRISKGFEVSLDGNHAIVGEGSLVCGRGPCLYVVSPSGKEDKVAALDALSPNDFVVALDSHGDHVAVLTFCGIVAVCNWRRRCILPEATVETGQGPVAANSISFKLDGTHIISGHMNGTILVWSFSGRRLKLIRKLEVNCDVRPAHNLDLVAAMPQAQVTVMCPTYTHIFTLNLEGNCAETRRFNHQNCVHMLRSTSLGISVDFSNKIQFWDLRVAHGGNPLPLGHFALADHPGLERSFVWRHTECPRTGVLAVLLQTKPPERPCKVALLPLPTNVAEATRPIQAVLVSLPDTGHGFDIPRIVSSPNSKGRFHVIHRDFHGDKAFVQTLDCAAKNDANTSMTSDKRPFTMRPRDF